MSLSLIKIYAVRVLTDYYKFDERYTKYYIDINDAYDYLGTLSESIVQVPVNYSYFVFVEHECGIKDGDNYFLISNDVISLS